MFLFLSLRTEFAVLLILVHMDAKIDFAWSVESDYIYIVKGKGALVSITFPGPSNIVLF